MPQVHNLHTDHGHDHSNGNTDLKSKSHSHSHSHGIFHSHSHSSGDSTLVAVLDKNDKASRITLIGLGTNTGLTLVKGVAGVFMNSASLLADAGHSMSDLLSDFVTLFAVRLSRRKPDHRYPYGYGKYETMGSIMISGLLILGAIGIGHHAYELIIQIMAPQNFVEPISTKNETFTSLGSLFNHSHSHNHNEVMNPHAAWFALGSVIIKEWLYQATKKVAKEENSDVLLANAWHHRSDAFTSIVALLAIVMAHYGLPIIDPVGGLLVAGMLLKTSAEIGVRAFSELVDVNLPQEKLDEISHAVRILHPDFSDLKGVKAGGYYLVDITLILDGNMKLEEAHALEARIRGRIKEHVKQVRSVRVHLHVANQPDETSTNLKSD